MTNPFADVDDVIARFDAHDYLLDLGTASAIYLAVTLGRPLLLEGEPGVGKTTAAKTLAAVMDTPLLRLQCYEGLTAAEALYDWNYQRQLLSIRLAEARRAPGSTSPTCTPRNTWSTARFCSVFDTEGRVRPCC